VCAASVGPPGREWAERNGGWILVHNDCDAVVLRLARVMVMVMGCEAEAGCPWHPRPECAGSFECAGGWCRVCAASVGPPEEVGREMENVEFTNGK